MSLDDTDRRLTLVSQEKSDRFEAFLGALGALDYRVQLTGPEALAKTAKGNSLVYLGMRGWDGRTMRRLKALAAHPHCMLAIEKSAFRWAEPTIRDCREFLTWPCAPSELKMRLERCGRSGPLGRPADERAAEVSALGLVGQSRCFVDSLVTLRRFAECDAAVLIKGETGTGKELAARAIHQLSARSEGPFVPVCCGALPDTLIEAELFGHARGAFTDAHEARAGLVEQARGGTLFLDEVEALSAKAQVALLRFLESLEFRRVGGSRTQRADVRVIAAGNEDLRQLARDGRFRLDLLYRLDVLSLALPPLRQRGGDVALLTRHFLSLFEQQYQTGALALDIRSSHWIEEYTWPGNVRELENLVHRGVVTAQDGLVSVCPTEPRTRDSVDEAFGVAKARAVNAFERRYLESVMAQTQGNVTKAAEQAGKERRALGKLLKKHGIDPAGFAQPSPTNGF
ncbi:sigma-54-dependent Fis family transcriptional regulator [Shimia sp. R9_2]|uniref:sigma 54-interacting transcriptional regulator n=1 Tax=Shimia sp. R9_2 TaxID=2821112 RepID=UPI001ADD4C6B|nr:sigma-54 dependent transcriptional regulator [Shimia sp. R9_2]MBO9398549.1 sigma-54-dependent Fis family transcriptional regulator [Shimia sp. R9_2]